MVPITPQVGSRIKQLFFHCELKNIKQQPLRSLARCSLAVLFFTWTFGFLIKGGRELRKQNTQCLFVEAYKIIEHEGTFG